MPSFGHSNPGYGYGGPRYPGTFLLALREALAKLNWQATAWKGNSVECTDPNGLSQHIGLENMYRRLKREPRETWPTLLADLLGSVPPEAATPPDNLHDVADQIFVRLGPPFARQEPALDVWSQPLVDEHLLASLVIDYPSSMSYVTEKMIAGSGQEGSYWLERALANLRGKCEPGCVTQVHEETGLLQAQVGDAYDSSRALLLDHLVPGHEQDGFFVIVPGRRSSAGAAGDGEVADDGAMAAGDCRQDASGNALPDQPGAFLGARRHLASVRHRGRRRKRPR